MSFNRTLLSLICVGGAAAVAACASTPSPDKVAEPKTPTEQYVLRAEQAPDELLLAPHMDLSPNQRIALTDLVSRWRDGERGVIVVAAPASGGEPASRTSVNARGALITLGVPADQVRIAGYQAEAGAPIKVAFQGYRAVVPQCGQSWGNLTASAGNKPQDNFGCAVTANMAAQIANPADIDHPRAMDPADGMRRATVFDKYRKGEVTSSQKDAQASAYVSKVVQ